MGKIVKFIYIMIIFISIFLVLPNHGSNTFFYIFFFLTFMLFVLIHITHFFYFLIQELLRVEEMRIVHHMGASHQRWQSVIINDVDVLT